MPKINKRMTSTPEQYQRVMKSCQSLFAKKMTDYGSAWRILRLPSLTDQIFIKAQRIRGLQTNTSQKVEEVKYSFGYMFKYSERPGTLAAKKLNDNVDEKIKSRRLSEIVELQQKHSLFRNKQKINQVVEILIEKESKKSANHWAGRNQQNSVVIIPKEEYSIGDFVNVKINDCTSATLIGKGLGYSKNN